MAHCHTDSHFRFGQYAAMVVVTDIEIRMRNRVRDRIRARIMEMVEMALRVEDGIRRKIIELPRAEHHVRIHSTWLNGAVMIAARRSPKLIAQKSKRGIFDLCRRCRILRLVTSAFVSQVTSARPDPAPLSVYSECSEGSARQNGSRNRNRWYLVSLAIRYRQ